MVDAGPYRDIQSQIIPLLGHDTNSSFTGIDSWNRACRAVVNLPPGQWEIRAVFQGILWRSVDSGSISIGLRDGTFGDPVFAFWRSMSPTLPFGQAHPLTIPRYMSYASKGFVVEGDRELVLEGIVRQQGTAGSLRITQQNIVGAAVRVG